MSLPPPSSAYSVLLAVTLLIVIGLGWASAYDPETLWAPGDLSAAHAGQTACTQCHTPFHGATTAKCLACHSDAAFTAQPASTTRSFHQAAVRAMTVCLTCHTEHRGASAQITDGILNPHGELIFRATGTTSCTDCHAGGNKKGPKYGLLDNAAVRALVARGKGAHGPGRFADCFRCHAGGRMGAEPYQ